jgi:tryptophan-rich sensory protein
MKNKIFQLAVSIVLCQAIGFLGSFFNRQAIPGWYAGLKKPVFNPPNWVFAPVWTLLFLLMGISFYLIWSSQAAGKIKMMAMGAFFIQLLLNFFWSYFFFYLNNPLAGLIEIVLLLVMIAVTMALFYQINQWAAWLLLPYLLWVCFAAVLNYSLWKLNS